MSQACTTSQLDRTIGIIFYFTQTRPVDYLCLSCNMTAQFFSLNGSIPCPAHVWKFKLKRCSILVKCGIAQLFTILSFCRRICEIFLRDVDLIASVLSQSVHLSRAKMFKTRPWRAMTRLRLFLYRTKKMSFILLANLNLSGRGLDSFARKKICAMRLKRFFCPLVLVDMQHMV